MNVLAAAIALAALASVVARQLLGRGPPVWILLLVGAFALVATGALPFAVARQAIVGNLPVLLFLFALFVLVGALEQAGFLEHVARWILGRARGPEDLPFPLFVGFGILSAFLLNDALVLVGVPLLFALARRLRTSVEPLLLTLAYAVTVGSVLTPFGNPQNLLISLSSGLRTPVATFLAYLLLPTAISLVAGGLFLRWALRPRPGPAEGPAERPPRVPFRPPGPLGPRVRAHPVLLIFPATMLSMIGVDLAGSWLPLPSVPLDLLALGGALLTLLTTAGRGALLQRVDWTILALFAGLFVVVAGAVAGGLLADLGSFLPAPRPADRVPAIGGILLASLVGSQLVSNVPWVALQLPYLHAAGFGGGTPWAWVALAGGSTLAGNLTLLGAASNLIIVAQAERAGVRIRLRTFVRYGLPLTLLSVGTLFVCLIAGV